MINQWRFIVGWLYIDLKISPVPLLIPLFHRRNTSELNLKQFILGFSWFSSVCPPPKSDISPSNKLRPLFPTPLFDSLLQNHHPHLLPPIFSHTHKTVISCSALANCRWVPGSRAEHSLLTRSPKGAGNPKRPCVVWTSPASWSG